jgi:hypothetical protein
MLIVGATGIIRHRPASSGIVGDAALTHFTSAPNWDVIAVSRRTPEPRVSGEFRYLAIDPSDNEATARACQSLCEVTHIVYAAVSEGPGLVTGWHDRDRMGAEMITRPTLLSTIKLRQAGFAGCRDSDDVIRRPVDELQDRRLIPHQGWPSP